LSLFKPSHSTVAELTTASNENRDASSVCTPLSPSPDQRMSNETMTWSGGVPPKIELKPVW
jgi:hypothetical protein